jgi:hypothetical protein
VYLISTRRASLLSARGPLDFQVGIAPLKFGARGRLARAAAALASAVTSVPRLGVTALPVAGPPATRSPGPTIMMDGSRLRPAALAAGGQLGCVISPPSHAAAKPGLLLWNAAPLLPVARTAQSDGRTGQYHTGRLARTTQQAHSHGRPYLTLEPTSLSSSHRFHLELDSDLSFK